MSYTREQAYEALASLNPAPVFLDSYRTGTLPESLEIYFGPPEECFDASAAKDTNRHDRRIPILDDGNFGVVTFLDPDTRELVQIDMDAADEPPTTFKHWQQYLADLLIRVADVEPDDRLRRIAALVGFEHTDKLFDFLEEAEGLDDDAWWEARRRFAMSIGDSDG